VSVVVKDIAFVAYSVRDIPRAVAFYRDVVGLEPGESFGDHWVEFNVGPTAFGIGNGEPLGFMPGTSTGASFEVDEIEGMRDRLMQHGTAVTDLYDFPNCRACFVTDPEGNRFALHQRKSSQ
jgi:predicted enzyme related to lactoylglutathione lyase